MKKVPTTAQVVPGAAVHIVLKQDQPTGRTVDGIVQTVLTRGNHPRGIKVRLVDGRVGRAQSMASGHGSGSNGSSGGDISASVREMAGRSFTSEAAAYSVRWGHEGFQTGVGGGFETADGMLLHPQEQVSLEAYIRPGGRKQNKQSKKRNGRDEHGGHDGESRQDEPNGKSTRQQTKHSPFDAKETFEEASTTPSTTASVTNEGRLQTGRGNGGGDDGNGKSASEPLLVICPVCQDFEGDEVAVSHHVASHF